MSTRFLPKLAAEREALEQRRNALNTSVHEDSSTTVTQQFSSAVEFPKKPINILADASLPQLAAAFPPPFNLTLYHHVNELDNLLAGQSILLCRSTLTVNETLLKNHTLSYVATASSGIDHLDAEYLQQKGVQIIDAKGCNANAVADYVIACLAVLQIKYGFKGNKAGIIGVGAVGSQVMERLLAANFSVVAYDPLQPGLNVQHLSTLYAELFTCDLICVHPNLHQLQPYPSLNFINESFLQKLKAGSAIINASRGGIVNEHALITLKPDIYYCTDVYSNEPNVNAEVVKWATICTPHIAGHSQEAKINAVKIVSDKLHAVHHLLPSFSPTSVTPASPVYKSDISWQDYTLTLYNPLDETSQLQNNPNLFTYLRKQHVHRHNFNCYKLPDSNAQIQAILGIN